nr:hypothetical protein [Tanacetum cinerariifolium]
ALPKGPLPPVVIREPELGKYQPLPVVPGKGKAKVSEEQVAHDLLSLQKHKKNSPVDQYIFQSAKGTKREIFGMPIPGRLITANIREAYYYQEYQENVAKHRGFLASETGSTQDLPAPKPAKPARKPYASRKTRQPRSSPKSVGTSEVEEVLAEEPQHKKNSPVDQYIFQRRVSEPTASSFHDESSYEVLGQSDSEEESEKIVLRDEKGGQDEGQVGPDPDAQAEDQTGSNAGAQAKGQAGSNPDETVLLEEPASSSGTLSSLQHLSRDFSFGDQFFSDKHSDADKSTETKVESMVNVTIQQDLSSISLMTSPIIDLTSRPESPKEHQQLKATTTNTTTTTTTTLPPQAPQQSTTEAMMVKRIDELEHILANLIQVNKTMEESEVVTDAIDWAMQAPLRNHFRDLPKADMKEILHQRMWESDSYKSHEDHMQLFEALEKSINHDHSEELTHDLAEVWKKRKKGRESPKTPHGSPSHQPPPPPPPAGPSGTSGAPRAFGSQVTPPPPLPTYTNQDSPSKGSTAPSPSKIAATTKHQAWTTPDVTLKPLVSLTPEDL